MISLIASIVGWVGMILIVSAYYLLSTKKLTSKSWVYHLINFFGGIGIVINTLINRAWPAMVLNILWALIAMISIIKITKTKTKKKK